MISLVAHMPAGWFNGKFMIHRHGRPLGVLASIDLFEDLLFAGLAAPGDWRELEAIIRVELDNVSPFDASFAPEITEHILDNLLPTSMKKYR